MLPTNIITKRIRKFLNITFFHREMNDENSSLPSFPSFLPLSFLITNKFCTEYLERGTAMVIFELSQIEIRPISANEANCCNDSNSYICMYVYVYIPIHPPLSLCLSREISIRGWFANFQCFDRKYRLNVISVPFNGTTKIEISVWLSSEDSPSPGGWSRNFVEIS